MGLAGLRGHLISENEIPNDAIEEVFTGDEFDPQGGEDEEDFYSRMVALLEESI